MRAKLINIEFCGEEWWYVCFWAPDAVASWVATYDMDEGDEVTFKEYHPDSLHIKKVMINVSSKGVRKKSVARLFADEKVRFEKKAKQSEVVCIGVPGSCV